MAASPKLWRWDYEGEPLHVGCHGEVHFFKTLAGETAAICHVCFECGLGWEETPDAPD